MKKGFVAVVCAVLTLVALINFLPQPKNNDCLRIDVKANSNLKVDQQIKYDVKCEVIKFLAPYLTKTKNSEDALKTIYDLNTELVRLCNLKLCEKGVCYTAKIGVDKLYFPEKVYENTTLNEGYFDAVVIELGEAKGDDWWDVIYPPLCFMNKNENSVQIKYKSRLKEFFSSVFKG